MNNFAVFYPHCAALLRRFEREPLDLDATSVNTLAVIDAGPGFDELDVEATLGPERFHKLMAGVKEVFCCGHRSYDASAAKGDVDNPQPATTHRMAGYEVHCIYAKDLEAFLAQEGK